MPCTSTFRRSPGLRTMLRKPPTPNGVPVEMARKSMYAQSPKTCEEWQSGSLRSWKTGA
jgi:hypothetical protein